MDPDMAECRQENRKLDMALHRLRGCMEDSKRNTELWLTSCGALVHHWLRGRKKGKSMSVTHRSCFIDNTMCLNLQPPPFWITV